VGSPDSGGALHELEPIRGEDAHEWASVEFGRAIEARAVRLDDLRRGALEGDLEPVFEGPVGHGRGDPRDRRVEANQLAVVRGPKRPADTCDVQGLQEIGLAGADRAFEHRHAVVEHELLALVVTEVPDAQA
jgi:hypothetical protein